MTSSAPTPPPVAPEEPVGLRHRVWVAALGGVLLVAIGVWVIAGTLLDPTATPDAWQLVAALLAVSGVGLLVGAVLAAWLHRGLVARLTALNRGLAGGRAADLRGLPGAAGWGELGELAERIQSLLVERDRERASSRAQAALIRDVERLAVALERGDPPASLEGPAGEVARAVAALLGREREQREALARELAALAAEIATALADARESAEQSERGFVEATALLTTVRELHRLGAELNDAVRVPGDEAARATAEAWTRQRAAAAAAIEELVVASAESVQRLGEALVGVREIPEQVQRVANHATLIALNALVAGVPESAAPEDRAARAEELKRLALDVRAATDRTAELARGVDAEVAAAAARMQGVRARVAERLEGLAPPPATAPAAADLGHRLDRVREMIQDATRKGERLSTAGERASRAAERLARRIEEDVRALEALLGPHAGAKSPARPGGAPEPFRVLGRDDLRELPEPDDATGDDREGRP